MRHVLCSALGFLVLISSSSSAQTVLPRVDVTAPYTTRHGGYVISSNFDVDSKMSAVVFPKDPLQKGDILFVKAQNLLQDEYLVLQECSRPDCTMGRILRVWNHFGALGITAHDPYRVWIPHEGKFFIWLQRFPLHGYDQAPFEGFEAFSPPLVLNPLGDAEQFQVARVEDVQQLGPEKVISTRHDGMDYIIRYESGTSVLVERMRAAD